MSAPPRRSRPHFEHVQAALQRHAPGPIDTVASCRSTEFSKSETDRNGTMYRNVAQFTPFTPTYWVFRAISGPFQGHSRAISGPFQGHLNKKIMIQHQLLYIWPRLSSPQHHRDPKTSQPHAKLWAPAITKVGWDSIIKIGHTMT